MNKLLLASPFLFPLYLFRFKIGGIPFTAMEVLTYGLFLGVAWEAWKTQSWKKKDRNTWIPLGLGAAIVIAATLSLMQVPPVFRNVDGLSINTLMMSLGIWKGWVMAPFLYFVALLLGLRSEKEAETIGRNFVYSAALLSLISHGWALYGPGLTYDFRMSGPFESANYLSLYLAPALLLAAYYLYAEREKPSKQRYAMVASLTAIAHTLFFTKSYAAVLAVFGALGLAILIAAIRHYGGLKKALKPLGILALAFMVFFATQIGSNKFKLFLDFENRSSTTVRLQIYKTSWELIKEHPFYGVGPGLFQPYYQVKAPQVLGQAPYEWNMPHPHNIFLAFWLNAGILGLLAFIGLVIFVHLKSSYALIPLWGTLIHGLFDVPFWKNDLSMIFWLLIAMAVILKVHGTHSSQKQKA